jgi:hypothetical protein
VALTVLVASFLPMAGAQAAEQAPGTGKPPKGTGINTAAAYANPQCNKEFGPYGVMGIVTVDSGAVCLPASKPVDNGGATYRGVTKDSVKVVSIMPNPEQLARLGPRASAQNYATGQPGTVEDAMRDGLTAYEHVFGDYMYGRRIDLEFVTSSGDDEASQRADAVAVLDKKPFLVLDPAQSLQVFDVAIANAEVPVFSQFADITETLKQAPYRWGIVDNTAASINGAEFVGKQVAGKKAEYAGDTSMHDQTRKLGLVKNDILDTSYFEDILAKYKVQIGDNATYTYPGTTQVTGDPEVAQAQAPTAIARLKAAGVTTVLLLADAAMASALTKQATAQDYHPEWVYLGVNSIDFPLLARGYDQEQWRHAFGIALIAAGAPAAATTPNVIQWYWGNQGTFQGNYNASVLFAVNTVMYAGPNLTPQTMKQGWFSIPASGGSAETGEEAKVRTGRGGYGRTSGLPYDEYVRGNKDFAVSWWDPDTQGPPVAGFPAGQGAPWFVNDGTRYYAGKWPTKPMPLFDKSKSFYQFDTPARVELVPCTGCPSQGGPGTPASSS